MDKEGKIDWSYWPKHFEKINKLDEISFETLREVLDKYKQAGKREIWVKHRHYGKTARIKEFIIDLEGNIKYMSVWHRDGGYGAWEAEHCKLINRPTQKRRKKQAEPKFKKVNNGVKKQPAGPCKEHPKYTGKRKPRTGCKGCLAYYSSNNSKKQENSTVKRATHKSKKRGRKSK